MSDAAARDEGGRRPAAPARLTRPRLYEQLADHIADFIDAQGLSPGDRLPPERRLAQDLGVSRATLSRALVALEVRGRVEVRHGDGAVVRHPAAAVSLPPLEEASAGELLQARLATMIGVARAATNHPDQAVRTALLGDDGTRRTYDDVWSCVRRLAGESYLVRLDDALEAGLAGLGVAPTDLDAVAHLAGLVLRGRQDELARTCAELLGLASRR